MRRWPMVFAASALLFTVSLHLPWQRASCGARCFVSIELDGWSSNVASASALFAALLAGLAALALVRPDLEGRLPLGVAASSVGYLALAVATDLHSSGQRAREVELHYAYGAYLAVAAAAVAVVAAGTRRRHLVALRSASGIATSLLGLGLLVAFLLPWQRAALPEARLTVVGISAPAAIVAAAFTLGLVARLPRLEARLPRPLLAAAVGLFTVAAFSSDTPGASRAYGAWIGLGLAIALVVVATFGRRELARVQAPPLPALATGGAAALFLLSLFLPWQRECYERAADFGPYAGRCFSTNGWIGSLGAAAALLAIGLVLVTLVSPEWCPPIVLAAGVALLVATVGFGLQRHSGSGFRIEVGIGSTVGFVGAGLLLVSALVGTRPMPVARDGVWPRLLPVVACVAYLVVVVVPWWGVLPGDVQSALRFAPVSWLTIVAVVLALWLLQLWVEQMRTTVGASDRLVFGALALLALTGLDLVRARHDPITWGHAIVVGACLVLCATGVIEHRVGLAKLRVPELLRVDRL